MLAGYLMQVPVLRGWGAFTPMALMTAVALLLIGVGLGAGVGLLFGPDAAYAALQKPTWSPPGKLFGPVMMLWFAALAPEYRVAHLQQHAHDPRFPVNDNWGNLVDELIHHLEQAPQPV